MDFHYRYTVNAPPEKLWNFMSDIPSVGMCIPGATQVEAADDGAYKGGVKVKVGPVSLTMEGRIRVEEMNRDAWRGVFTGEAADRRVPGNVRIKVTMQLEPKDGATDLVIDSEANIAGKLGEFGQAVIKRKADGMMKEFGENVARKVEAG